MRVYISGPITGDPGARWKFDQAAQIIADRGHDYINPARLAETIPNAGWEYYMALDLQMLKQADAIVQLPAGRKARAQRESTRPRSKAAWRNITSRPANSGH